MNFTQMAESAAAAEKNAVLKAEEDPTVLSYVQSFHLIRTGVGIAGAALPPFLVLGWAIFKRDWNPQGSLSAYYHTGMRDFFVSVLVVVGVLLYTYKLATKKSVYRLSSWAGIASLGVAFIPTAIDPVKQPTAKTTAVQELLTEDGAQAIHFLCATAFIVLLAFLCLVFARMELEKGAAGFGGKTPKRPPHFWYRIHRWMAFIIFGAVGVVGVSQLFKIGEEYSILLGETVATVAFGISWLIKGLDLKILQAKKPETGDQMPGAGATHL